MARVNIDDELHAEKGFKRLVKNLGDEDKAVGLLYRFWRQAQDYWGKEESLMPLEEFEEDGFGPILEAKLAQKRPGGIYACGAEERFAWYLQKCRASKEGVRARLENRTKGAGTTVQPIPNDRSTTAGQPERTSRSTETLAPDNPLIPVPVPAPVSSTATVSASAVVPAPDSAKRVDNSAFGGDNFERERENPEKLSTGPPGLEGLPMADIVQLTGLSEKLRRQRGSSSRR